MNRPENRQWIFLSEQRVLILTRAGLPCNKLMLKKKTINSISKF